jgi:hypothetical protein
MQAGDHANRSNQALELTATRRTTFFSMTSTLSPAAARALSLAAAHLVFVRRMASKRIVWWSVGAALLVVAAAVVIDKVFIVDVPEIFVRTELTQIAVRLEIYEKRHGSYPTTQQGLRVLVTDGLLPEMPLDQWHHDYVYRFPSIRAGYSFDLFSLGPDGVESSDDLWLTR